MMQYFAHHRGRDRHALSPDAPRPALKLQQLVRFLAICYPIIKLRDGAPRCRHRNRNMTTATQLPPVIPQPKPERREQANTPRPKPKL